MEKSGAQKKGLIEHEQNHARCENQIWNGTVSKCVDTRHIPTDKCNQSFSWNVLFFGFFCYLCAHTIYSSHTNTHTHIFAQSKIRRTKVPCQSSNIWSMAYLVKVFLRINGWLTHIIFIFHSLRLSTIFLSLSSHLPRKSPISVDYIQQRIAGKEKKGKITHFNESARTTHNNMPKYWASKYIFYYMSLAHGQSRIIGKLFDFRCDVNSSNGVNGPGGYDSCVW